MQPGYKYRALETFWKRPVSNVTDMLASVAFFNCDIKAITQEDLWEKHAVGNVGESLHHFGASLMLQCQAAHWDMLNKFWINNMKCCVARAKIP